MPTPPPSCASTRSAPSACSGKNLGTEDEIRQLTTDLRAAMGEHALIGIDQEGGSVIRLHDPAQAPAAMAPGRLR